MPLTESTSPPTFSMVGIPAWASSFPAGLQAGKSVLTERPGALGVAPRQLDDVRPDEAVLLGQRGGQRVVDRRGVDGDQLHLPAGQPLRRGLGKAGAVAEVLHVVGVAVMPAGVQHHDVPGPDLPRRLEIGRLQVLPFALGHVQHHPGAEERVQRQLSDARAALGQVNRGVQVRAVVHRGDDVLGQDALFGDRRHPVDLDIGVAGESRGVMAPFVTELHEFQAGRRLRDHPVPPTIR